MKTLSILNLIVIGLFNLNGHAVQIAADARGNLNVACLAQTAAAKAKGELYLNGSREDFCECIAGRHVREAKKSVSDVEANRYLGEVLSFYKPLNKSESAQARAAYPESNEMDFQVIRVCQSN